MAQAQKTVWLEPEEQHDSTPRVQSRRQRRQASPFWQSPFLAIGIMAIAVGFLVAYISSYARIARYEFMRQERVAELRQVQDDCARLKLEIANLESAARVAQVAKTQDLAYPSADRVHYIHVASIPSAQTATPSPSEVGQRSWFARAGHAMVARMSSAFHQIGHEAPAYAQE